jgi:pimeloyl-ACP methyl ester carboxylesterase
MRYPLNSSAIFPADCCRARALLLVLCAAWLALLGGCARGPITGVTTLRTTTLSEMQGYLLSHKAGLDQFRVRGPFEVTVRDDQALQLSAKERVEMDVYLSSAAEKAPLVIFLHGHGNTKDDHAYQAMHLATWGMHAVTVQLPSQGPWVRNGQILARITEALRSRPEAIDPRVDPARIILAGHSFGASAAAVALGEGAPAVGAVLLDPSGLGKEMYKFLGRVNRPVVLFTADWDVSRTRDRGVFYELIRSGLAEVSIRDAAHEDAQFPLEPPAQLAGNPTEEHQITFVSALTAAAFSLGFTGNLDYVWTSIGEGIQNGRLFDALRK